MYKFNFKSKGIHRIYFTLNLEGVKSLDNMFSYIKNLTSISFSPSFNTVNITDLRIAFHTVLNCNQLIYLI